MRVVITVPDTIALELQAAAKACHLSTNEWASEVLHAAIAVKRLMRIEPPPRPTARLPGEHVSLTVKRMAEVDEMLDEHTDLGPDVADVEALENIS